MATKEEDIPKGLEKYLKPTHFPETGSDIPSHVIGTLLPPWELIPDEFKNQHRPEEKVADKVLICRYGIIEEDAKMHLLAIANCQEPSFAHRQAGINFLRSLWFYDEAVKLS